MIEWLQAAPGTAGRLCLTVPADRVPCFFPLLQKGFVLGGAVGITLSGYAYGWGGWFGVATLGLVMLTVPLVTGLREMREPADWAPRPKEELSTGV